MRLVSTAETSMVSIPGTTTIPSCVSPARGRSPWIWRENCSARSLADAYRVVRSLRGTNSEAHSAKVSASASGAMKTIWPKSGRSRSLSPLPAARP